MWTYNSWGFEAIFHDTSEQIRTRGKSEKWDDGCHRILSPALLSLSPGSLCLIPPQSGISTTLSIEDSNPLRSMTMYTMLTYDVC